MKEEIGTRLKDLRSGLRLTQIELANTLGTQQSSINRYEHGQSVPSPEILVKYADYFDVSMDYIYCRTDDPHGKYFDYHPKVVDERLAKSNNMRDFIEMCFDPASPVSTRMKETLFQLFKEADKE